MQRSAMKYKHTHNQPRRVI